MSTRPLPRPSSGADRWFGIKSKIHTRVLDSLTPDQLKSLNKEGVRDQIGSVVERIIAANSRTPELVLGDIRGQLGASRLGEQRLVELVRKFGKDNAIACFARLLELSEARMRAAIAEWVDGRFEAERFVDDDGIDLNKPVRIHVVVEKKGKSIAFDFSGSADQTKGPANVRPPLVKAAVAYCLISLVDPHIFINSGILRAFEVKTREGSVLNPRFPAPVNTYNATVHGMVESLFSALSHVVPSRARADGCGSRSTTVRSSGTITITLAQRAASVAAPWKPGACTVAIVNATSAEVSGTPSCQRRSGRRTNVYVRPSGVTSHDSARSGTILAVFPS